MAPTFKDVKLIDVVTRHQIYLEGVKLAQGQKFNNVTREFRRDLLELFATVEYEHLNQLSKHKIELFIRQLKKQLIKHYDGYSAQLLADLQAFTRVDANLHADIMDETQDKPKKKNRVGLLLSASGLSILWAEITGAALPANGMMPLQFIEQFKLSSVAAVEQAVRRAWANGDTTNKALASIIGTARLNRRDGLLTRFAFQNDAVVSTLWQHASSIAQAAVNSIYFEWYRWVSVIDGHTSDICLSRNGKVYRFGEGPLPPAHVRCRSKTEPVDPANMEPIDASYFAWLKRQPPSIQDDVLGKARADDFRAGKIGASDLDKFDSPSPLTLEEFAAKLSSILSA